MGLDASVFGIKAYRDFYVGVDDGEDVAGNVISVGFDFIIGIEMTFDHRTEQGGRYTNKSGNAYDGPLDMLTYPETKKVLRFRWLYLVTM